MAATKTLRIVQTVHVPHNVTIVQSWYDVVDRIIERTIDADGAVLSEETVEEVELDSRLDMEEEEISRDEDTEDEEIVETVFEDDDED